MLLLFLQPANEIERAICEVSRFSALVWRERVELLPPAYVEVPENGPRLEVKCSRPRVCGIYDCIIIAHAWLFLVQQIALAADLEPAM